MQYKRFLQTFLIFLKLKKAFIKATRWRLKILELICLLMLVNCASVPTERAVTTIQYFAPLAIGLITIQSFGLNK